MSKAKIIVLGGMDVIEVDLSPITNPLGHIKPIEVKSTAERAREQTPWAPVKPRNGSKKNKKTPDEVNTEARKLLEKMGDAFFKMTEAKISKMLKCHYRTWRKTALYRTACKKGQIKPAAPKGRKVVNLSDDVIATHAHGKKDEVVNSIADTEEDELRKLIAEQKSDDEGSPFEEKPRKKHTKKR